MHQDQESATCRDLLVFGKIFQKSLRKVGGILLKLSPAFFEKLQLKLLKTNSSPLKMGGCKPTFLFGRPSFRGYMIYMSFREDNDPMR